MTTSSNLKWDNRFLELAQVVSAWSKDPSTKVGCVLVDEQNRVISLGFNGPPRGVLVEYRDRDQRLLRTIHAERNALTFANTSVRGATAYITHPPCAGCTAALIQSQIGKVVFVEGGSEFLERWGEQFKESLAMLGEAGVEVETYTGVAK